MRVADAKEISRVKSIADVLAQRMTVGVRKFSANLQYQRGVLWHQRTARVSYSTKKINRVSYSTKKINRVFYSTREINRVFYGTDAVPDTSLSTSELFITPKIKIIPAAILELLMSTDESSKGSDPRTLQNHKSIPAAIQELLMSEG